MVNNSNQENIKGELLQSIAYFVKRQEIVANAIVDFNLELDDLAQWGALAWNVDIELTAQQLDGFPDDLKDMVARAIKRNFKLFPQKGIWTDDNGQVWEYYMHGGGCCLIHTITGEIIDWDCPDTKSFDPFKFSYHLLWQLENQKEKYPCLREHVDKKAAELSVEQKRLFFSDFSEQLIDDLIADGLITPNYTLA